jgi:hypothetical protein
MIKWLWLALWGGCDHKWKILSHGDITLPVTKQKCGTYYELQCEKCGDIKARNLIT